MSFHCTAFLQGHEGIVWSCAWHPNGRILATCGQDQIIRLWKNPLESEKFSREEGSSLTLQAPHNLWALSDELQGAHQRTIRNIDFSPDGRTLAAAGFDGLVSIWVIDGAGLEWKCMANLEGHENEVKSVSWSPNGSFLATCGRDKTVWIWELNPGMDEVNSGDVDFECLAVLAEHSQDVKMVQFHPLDSGTLLSASYDDSIKIWHSKHVQDDEWVCKQTLSHHKSTVWTASFSPCGRFIVSAGDDRRINVYQRNEKGYELVVSHEMSHERSIMSISIQHKAFDEGQVTDLIIASCAGDRKIRLWRCNVGNRQLELLATYEEPGRIDLNSVRWSPKDPWTLAVVGDDGLVRILTVSVD
ncbi:putative cytosolic iron-sulfur protein assembly protein 1 [Paramicrosporidium saccamoebae]|uniref:Probable cytosolic iron-sulfur protein assembly protein 1 n=1 Tax=Paramicrosporidium saccamoebae TaxID=1246581 RepID=A0A2H9TQQ7_9FUNG|nr:putative cytosolic iron-sulfur protein assembly protein 1 [Paramicrosporidium saccamoebae]